MPDARLSGTLEQNRKVLRRAFGKDQDAVFRDVLLPASGRNLRRALVVYFTGHVDSRRLEAHLIRPLIEGHARGPDAPGPQFLPTSQVVTTLSEAARALNRGRVLLQLGDSTQMFALDLAQVPHRDIEAPGTELGVSGPRESFTEQLITNMTQLRRRLPGTDLRLERIWVGRQARLEAVLAYVAGRPTEQMLATLRERLRAARQDGVQDVTELAEGLSDRPVTIYPTVLISERPDVVMHYLMGGRVAVLLENSPRALIVPALFMDFHMTPDDFYEWRPFILFLRLLRLLSFGLAVLLPALYVSVTTFHLQALPTLLTLSLLAQREGAPLPAPVEAFLMTVVFEILREAGVRLPRAIGPTVSIVGGLVIGEAAIRSGITSPAMVLVVSATAVATFALPSPALAQTATYLRFLLLLLTSTFGFLGLMLGYLLILGNLAASTSLGVPYMAPGFPLQLRHWLTALGVQPRPPRGHGAAPPAAMTREAERFQEQEE